MIRWRSLLLVLTLAVTARADEPLHRPLTDAEKLSFGAPLAQMTRAVMFSIPQEYQPCELTRDAADLVRPDTLVEGDAIVTDGVIYPDTWAIGIQCKTGMAIVRFDRLAIDFKGIRMENLSMVARSLDYLHLRQKGPERGEMLFVRSAEDPRSSGLATPRTIEVRWIGMNPRSSVEAATKAARQLMGMRW